MPKNGYFKAAVTITFIVCILLTLLWVVHNVKPPAKWWCMGIVFDNPNEDGRSKISELHPNIQAKALREYEIRRKSYYEFRIDIREAAFHEISYQVPPLSHLFEYESYIGDAESLSCMPSDKPWLFPRERHPRF